jgi:long-subunit fatty acid transport protein
MNMKKFIVLAVAALSMNAFAQKHMVTLSGYETGDQTDRSLDFGYGKNDADAEVKVQNIALNYAYALNDQWQVGGVYKNYKATVDGDVVAGSNGSTTMGLQAIYNFSGLTNSNYIALGYQIQTLEESDVESEAGANDEGDDDDKTTTISLEFGHRFSLGNLWGMNFNYSPSAVLSQSTLDPAASGSDEVKTTAVTLNFVKFDVLF